MKNAIFYSILVLVAAVVLFSFTSQTTTAAPELRCPTVCIPMWEVSSDACVFDECGSGCGPNGLTTFWTGKACLTALYNLCGPAISNKG